MNVDQKDSQLGCVAGLIRSTLGAEIVRATPDHIVFCGQGPRRTFDIRREGAQGYRVEEIMGFHETGRNRQPTSHLGRTVINRSQMIDWVTARLEEVRTSSFFAGGFSVPEASTILMMIASALITIGPSVV